ncbi:MAG: Xaa-Pro peptidase family protein [Desulfobacterales bacterium]|nr:Xaa-Pro peptidase family protein [Desulfobacterales bacterium]
MMKPDEPEHQSNRESPQPFTVPAGEIAQRLLNIQTILQQKEIGGLFIVQRVDLFYFSGTAQNGFLFIPAEGEPLLFIKRYLPRARAESPLKQIVGIESIKEVPGLISDYYGQLPEVNGFEFDVLPVKTFYFYRRLFPAKDFVDGSRFILQVRMIKSDWEIEQLERTADMSCRTFEYMQTIIRPGLSEMEFAGMFETFARKLGHGAKLRVRDFLTEGYPWHVLSGKSGGLVGLLDSPASGAGTSAAFPCGGSAKPLAPNEPIMVDLGFVLNGYHMDETRMFAIGSIPAHALRACRAAIEIHNAVLASVKPGMTVAALFQCSLKTAESLGYADPYLGPPGLKVTFVGHGIGLELIEPPFIARDKEDCLKPGMVFALEPKMVFQNEFAAGVESVFVVTETGARLISKVPVDIFIC